ncbi:MAG TPA: GNAT family protein [candidate division Zixibacteria bacterium]|nr:GNAT family protein [candidate division Zixibacteria bacterium]
MLEGKLVNLSVIEKEDIPILAEWFNNPKFWRGYGKGAQPSKGDIEKLYDKELAEGGKWFFIEKKDGTKVGYIDHFLWGNMLEIGYGLIPKERRKGYCTEAAKMMVDYLFLSKDIVRIQVVTNVKNIASQKVIEKTGFKKEGILRKAAFVTGVWADFYIFSILREEWKEPKILTKTT